LIVAAFAGMFYLQALKEAQDRIQKYEYQNGCKYLVNTVRGGKVLTHAGDCASPVHKQ
jgi:hypothetical protein